MNMNQNIETNNVFKDHHIEKINAKMLGEHNQLQNLLRKHARLAQQRISVICLGKLIQ